ncbi:MAG: hypothetical protein ACKOA9_01400 [Actinomycetota bacterium]
MGEHDAGNDTVDRALRLFVYGPIGLACYLKDSGPTFLGLFVSRGRREVDSARKTVEQRLGWGRPEPAPTPQQRVADGIGNLTKVAAQAGAMVASVAGPVVNAATSAASGAASTVAAGTTAPAPAGPGGASTGNGADLPISGYDGLSASQVIERLDGMSRDALERVRAYETAHRARRTILASIDQRTS